MKASSRCLWLFLCFGFISSVWAQNQEGRPGKHFSPRHRMDNQTSRRLGLTASQSFNVQANPGHAAKTWELGTYKGGTWFATLSINDFGVIVGRGDVPPLGDDGVGYTHTLAVPLFGPHAGEWFDLGALDGDQSRGAEFESVTIISNTGLVVGHSTAQDGYVHGVVWTKETGMVELGTLADTGDPAYEDYKSSLAFYTNKLGTLIVGISQPTDGPPLPVVWTPAMNRGGPAVVWKIHRLDTLAELPYGQAWGLNDFGQITGVCGGNVGDHVTGVVWNPRADGKGWQLRALPLDPDYPNSNAYGINERGEITGVAISGDGSIWLPRLWKPLNRTRTKYSDAIELSLPDGLKFGGESVGINDLGDMVGDCWNDDYSLDLAVRWSTKDPSFSEIINFPMDWGFAWGVNNNRIAVVQYYGGNNCPSGGPCGGAVQLP